MTIKLYELCGADTDNIFSPHCWKTRYALAHKGLEFDSVTVPFSGVASIEGGPSRKVPVMRDGDTVIEESFEIAKYLDKTHPDAPALIGSPQVEALTAFTINWSQSQLHPMIARLILMNIYESLAPEDQAHFRTTREKIFGMTLEAFAEKNAATKDDLAKTLVPLELTLKKQAFINGTSPMFADYVVFGALQFLRIFKGDDILPQGSAVAAWFDGMLDMYGKMGRNAKPLV